MQPLKRPYAKTLFIIAVAYLAFGLISIAIDLKGMLGRSGWPGISDLFSANWPEVLYIMGLFIMLIFAFIVYGEPEDLEKS